MKKIKFIIVAMIFIIYGIVKNLFYPVLINEATISQFDNTAESFINIQAQQMMWHNSQWILLFVVMFIFTKEIKLGVSKLIKKMKEEI
jgi:hypothetical protein